MHNHKRITEETALLDYSFFAAILLLAVTTAILVKYIKQLRDAQREYEKAKSVVQDIVLSFNRQFKRAAERLEFVAYKVEANSSRSDRALSKGEEVEKNVKALEDKVNSVSTDKEKTSASLEEITNRLRDIATSQEALAAKISGLEEQTKQFSTSSEMNVETAIPIRRDKALAPLTPTELTTLETMAAEGPKTAPEIKWRIKLSREHTARLMKKLYEEGYLERDPSKIPFKYSVKKEMEKLLKKPENGTTQT
ncbi:MAG TPA: MarR family transcriptional regulator [Candidatus Bathyarchaeia archaeon]|jgi:archaellum component FlaC|nr:MarR family transcriptional regulator [Candidatus Bathyarchaeia archaeon]